MHITTISIKNTTSKCYAQNSSGKHVPYEPALTCFTPNVPRVHIILHKMLRREDFSTEDHCTAIVTQVSQDYALI